MRSDTYMKTKTDRGFTLLELLVVITIMVILAAAVGPGITGTLDGVNLTGGAGKVVDEIEFARQTALTRNLPVEIRIYTDGDTNRVASLINVGTTSEWLSPGRPLPQGVLIDDDTTFSSLLDLTPITESTSGVPLGLRSLPYYSFTFRPDGTTDLDMSSEWTLTIRNANINQDEQSPDRPAHNFITVSIDPVTGRTSTFQP